MIKNKAKYFKTLYIRFLSKSDKLLDKEVTEMVNNLRTYGAKTSAKSSSIQSQVISAIKGFDQLR